MKMTESRSIRQKLNFIVVATTVLALGLAGALLLFFDSRRQLQAIENDLVTQAEMIGLVTAPALAFDDREVAVENLSVLQAKPHVVSAAIYGPHGEIFASFQNPGSKRQALPSEAAAAGVHIDAEWLRVWRPVRSGQDVIGMAYLQGRHDLLSGVLKYVLLLAAVMGVSLGGAILLSNRLQRAITGPILAISDVALRILQGRDFTLRAPRSSEDEVGAMADVFNAMLDELSRRAQVLEKANLALRESEERYQLAVRGSSAGLWDWDMQAGTVIYSPRFKALLGYLPHEFPDLPSSLMNVMQDDDRARARETLRLHLTDDKPYQLECRLQLKSGAWRWFFIAGSALKDATGRAFRMAGSIVDVTERKNAEQVLHDASRAKDEFLATLAHELRNPLAPIRTGLAILKHDPGNGPACERARQTMERQLQHMVRLIDDLMDISRITSGKIRLEPMRIKLAPVIQTALEITRPAIVQREHHLVLDLPSDDIELMGDATRLAQAAGNLISNAAKYTPHGGRVQVSVRREGTTAIIEVTDNGLGIPRDMLEEVFTLFTQVTRTLDRSQGGLGIGLSLVRSLVELHAGTVTAYSAGNSQGSTFTVRLPCLPGTTTFDKGVEDSSQSNAAAAGLNILVVDDNVDAADTLATVLELLGHRTRTVHQGDLVLDVATQFAPQVVLLDIGLPGMSGYDVARQLRGLPQFSRTSLIAITGWGSDKDRRQSQEAGFDDHLTKPVDLEVLGPMLERLSG
jgi:PAS domain S-box-containing protein